MSFKSVSIIAISALLFIANSAEAAKKRGGKGVFGGGSLSLGIGIGFATAEQSGINDIIKNAKANNQATTSELKSAMEYSLQPTFTFSNGLVAIQLRPSIFTQSESGTGSAGSYSYSLSGFTVFPLVRIIPLSNDIIDFYIQAGLGYGKMDGDITNGPSKIAFTGSSFGMQAGLGANFCFVPDHCIGVEGNYRYLPVQRNITSSTSGGLSNNITQATKDAELEVDGSDMSTTFSGISGALSYTYNF
jgi:opacity protein-like surface antigen